MKSKEKKRSANQSVRKKTSLQHENAAGNEWILGALAVVFITTLLIYFNATKFHFLFSWDDNIYITTNNDIRMLYWENIKSFFTKFYMANYQPVTMLFYAIEYKIGAGKASVFHFTSILMHILNTSLVFVLIRKISPASLFTALITAACFAVHPMHVESVAWVSEQKDMLYSFFFLLSLVMYTNYLKSGSFRYLGYTAVFFVLSCLSKSAAVVLPLVMLLFDYYLNRKFHWRMLLEKVPFFMVSLVFGIIAIVSQNSAIQDMAPSMNISEHVAIVSFSFISYLFKALIPVNLSAIYPYPPELGQLLPAVYYLAILCVGLVVLFAWYSRKWGKEVLFGFLFFVITIILVLQIIPAGAATMADRYTYIPYIGIFYIFGRLFDHLYMQVKSTHKTYLLVAFSFVFLFFSSAAYSRVKIWENDETVFSDVINKYPFCGKACFLRGSYDVMYYADVLYAGDGLKKAQYLKAAIGDFENAAKYALMPMDKARSYYNLGYAKFALNDFQGAARDYSESIRIDSLYGNAFINRGNCYRDYYANVLYASDSINRKTYLRKSASDYEKALTLKISREEKVTAYSNLGAAKNDLGDYVGAITNLNEAIIIDDKYVNAYNNRGAALYMLKKYDDALADFIKIIELNPQFPNAVKNRDLVLSSITNSRK
ncbi:MAG: tetratricopeptide repeat protein [bacterium]